jgi:hypothetical protein
MKFKELRESITSRMISMAVKHTTPKKKSMVKEGEAEDSLAKSDKDKFKSKSYMDNDGGAAVPKNFNGADKYMDKGPASGTVKKTYMDKGPATPPVVKEEYPQIGDGIYLELDDVLIETEIIDETEDGFIIYMDEQSETLVSKIPEFIFGKDTVDSLKRIKDRDRENQDPMKKTAAAADFWSKRLNNPTGKNVNEAEYQGRDVSLNKPMAGDVAKSKVYVKGPSGRVVKVNFGDKNLSIKKHIPARRKSFRARHKCETPGPKHKARYWSCKAW